MSRGDLPRAGSSPASNGLKKSEAGCEMFEHPLVRWDFHDRGTLKALGLQYLHHASTVEVPGVHRRVGPAVPRLLEMHNLDHILREGLEFSQRVAVRIAPQLVGRIRTQPQIFTCFWRETGAGLTHQQGHAANGLARVLH